MNARIGPTAPDSAGSWLRLLTLLALGTIGGVGMWSVVVTLPAVQADFASARGGASLAYTLTMIGFGVGGVVMGKSADRLGIARTVAAGAVLLATGYIGASLTGNLWAYAALHLVAGAGSSAIFAPLMADISQWFVRRRGLAVAICASGNYLAGAVWPPIVEHAARLAGWRATEQAIGLFCAAAMLPLAASLRGRRPAAPDARTAAAQGDSMAALGLSPVALQWLLAVAGVACCVAMAMPQVHIVAYCGDLGYGAAHGADMLALMMACGIVSRVGSGWVADRIGGLPTLLLGSLAQGLSLVLYLGFDGLASLYIISALFGLFQGGIVPSYAIIVREYFPAREAGTRVGVVIMATVFGMALGGWMSGAIFDLTGSYRDAFANGVLWNVLNGAIAIMLIWRHRNRDPRRTDDLGMRIA